MINQKLSRLLGYGAITLVALGALGYAVDRRDASPDAAITDEPGFGADESVSAAIGQALGREPGGFPALAPDFAAESKAEPGGGVTASDGGVAVTASGADPFGLSDDRKIVQTAALNLQVEEVGPSFEAVGRIATADGGFVASSNFSFQGEKQVASMTIRVPTTRYQDVLREVRALGAKVDSETSNASDVTEEYSDLAARVRNLEATEGQLLLLLLGEATTINEILQVQDRLNGVRGEIERAKGRIALLDKLTELATVTVNLRPVVAVVQVGEGGGVDLGAEVEEAWAASMAFLGGIAAGVVRVVVFAWWLPIVGLPLLLILQRWARGRPEALKSVD